MIKIRVPATTANMGPGFDSIGMALSLYNYLTVSESDKPLEIEIMNDVHSKIPRNKENLIYRSMCKFYDEVGKKIPSIKMVQEDFIPHTRGLGSSAACIVAGLCAANELSSSNLSKDDLAQIAAKIEGHPDNSTPAIMGGLVVGAIEPQTSKLNYVKLNVPNNLSFAVMIPDFPLATEKARKVLPKQIPLADAVFNSSRSALLIASLVSGNFDNLKIAFDDRLHQPYRKSIIPHMEDIFNKAYENSAKGVFLSGAGPTIISAFNNDSFVENMNSYLSSLNSRWDLVLLEPDTNGVVVEKY